MSPPPTTPIAPDASPAPEAAPVGVLVIDKPLGRTSAAICNAVKARLIRAGAARGTKVGHAGTLDPMATGVLVLLIGRPATRLAESLMAGRKRYLAEIDLAHTSESDDTEREPVPAIVSDVPTRAAIEHALPAFVGAIMQRPPSHSAIRVGGRRAYRIARKGRDPMLSERRVLVHDLRILDYAWPRLTLDVECGKGMYVRSLARDLGAALGVGGMLAALRRLRVGPYDIADARPLDDLPEGLTQPDLLPPPPPPDDPGPSHSR